MARSPTRPRAPDRPSTGRPADLRRACIDEATAIIEARGVEDLSLREVARRLHVSHQAPYKHFPSRDHLLAAVVQRAFTAFAEALEARPHQDEPRDDLRALGRTYFRYAAEHPLQYRLMFGTPLPDPDEHVEMMSEARRAFALLRDALVRREEALLDDADAAESELDWDALFIWSTIHGLASILQSDTVRTLGLPTATLEAAPAAALRRIGAALDRGDATRAGDREPSPDE